MDYVKPVDVVSAMVEAGARKAALPVSDLLIRGALSGGILGIATSLAVTATVQTMPIRLTHRPATASVSGEGAWCPAG